MMKAEEMIKTALGEVGYLEKAGNAELENKTANAGRANFTKYGKWYGINPGEWCAMFVSWCAWKCGGGAAMPKHASCTAGIAEFKRRGRWHDREGYEPKAGDIIYFADSAGPRHVGLVTRVAPSRVYTVEGNTSAGTSLVPNGGAVAEKNYSKGYSRILGYGSPEYIVEEEMKYEDFVEFMKRYEAERAEEAPAEWSKEAREWAEKNGIIKGDGESLKYRAPLTREEYVVMEYRQNGGEG